MIASDRDLLRKFVYKKSEMAWIHDAATYFEKFEVEVSATYFEKIKVDEDGWRGAHVRLVVTNPLCALAR